MTPIFHVGMPDEVTLIILFIQLTAANDSANVGLYQDQNSWRHQHDADGWEDENRHRYQHFNGGFMGLFFSQLPALQSHLV